MVIEDYLDRANEVQYIEEMNFSSPYDGRGVTPSQNSFSPINALSWDKRIDPLWETTFHSMSRTSWGKSSIKTHGIYDDGTGVLRNVGREVYSPIDLGEGALYSQTSVTIMAIIVEYQMCSTEHIMILAGDPNKARVSNALDTLFVSGIINKAGLTSELTGEKTTVWTINKKSDEFADWLFGLEPWQYQLIAGGRDIVTEWATNQSSAARHNISVMDIMVKAMEVSPYIMGAWGERHSTADIFADQKLLPTEQSRDNVGDGLMVTPSGTVILLEASGATMTGRARKNNVLKSVHQNISASHLVMKAAAWVAIAARTDIDLRVVFVDVATKPSFKRMLNAVNVGVNLKSDMFIADSYLREKGMEKIYVADAREWMPIPRMVSSSMETLDCIQVAKSGKSIPLLTEEDGVVNTKSPFVTNTLLSMHNPEWAAAKALNW